MNDLPVLPESESGKEPLVVAIQAAREAGGILKQRFSQKKQIENKGRRNLVTEIDLLSEKTIVDILAQEYPDHSILCEESGKTENSSRYRWIIDPLDGTTNYAFGVPMFCVSIALTFDDEAVVSVIYDPLKDELFRAENGKGAFLNDVPVSVTRNRGLGMTLIGFDMGYDDAMSRDMLSRANGLWSPDISFRLIGSAALGLTYVAGGRLDIYFHRSIYPWDIAAATLLVREAGGEVKNWEGDRATVWDSNIIACGDFHEHRELIGVLM